jgi:glycosyltransferase involved in cell wall biosynthesis
MAQAQVSVIIPVYNCEAFIAQAIESVMAQTYSSLEIIVIDDGSTDGTADIVRTYSAPVRYVRQPHLGVAAARNRGIGTASGDFIAFLDADDVWLPEKLELQMEYFSKHDECGLIYTDMGTFDESGIVHASVKSWLKMSPPSGRIFKQLFVETLFAADSVVFRKACLARTGPFDESLLVGEDYDMWLRIAWHFQVAYLDKPLVKYRQHQNMTTRRLGTALVDGIPWELRVIKKILDLYPEANEELGNATVRKRFARPFFFLGVDRLSEGQHRQARSFFSRALRHWPLNLRCQLLLLATFLTPKQLSQIRDSYHRLCRLASTTWIKQDGSTQPNCGS